MEKKVLLKGCTGLNTSIDPRRLPVNFDTATTDLGIAVNVDIDHSGMIGVGLGFSSVQTVTSGHSLFCDAGACLLAQGSSLYQVAVDYSLLELQTGMTGERLSYLEYGGSIYYTNGYDKGIIYEGVSYAWEIEEYVGPTTRKHFEGSVPVFEHIDRLHGLLIGSINNILYESELGQFGLFNMQKGTAFPNRIIMVKAVDEGIFVSDTKAIYFLRGLSYPYIMDKVANYPAYEYSASVADIDADDIGLKSSGLCKLWSSKKGICIGTSDGKFLNITRKKIIFPANGSYGATHIRGYNVITTLDSDFCLDVNMDGYAATEKDGFNFNSFCKFNDHHLALSSTGLHTLGGDDYNGSDIDAYFEPLLTDFGYHGNKRVRKIYLQVESNGSFEVIVTAYGGPNGTQTETIQFTSSSDGIKMLSSTIERMQGVYWKFRVQNVDGSYLNIDSIEVLVNLLSIGKNKI